MKLFPPRRLMFSLVTIACLVVQATVWSKPPNEVQKADGKQASSSQRVTFEEHIKPIFRQHCSACHSQGNQKGGLALDTYTSVVEGGGGGEVVFDDGDYDGSRLWQLVNHDDSPEMPPNQDKIPNEQLELVRRWIQDGIPENSGDQAKPKKKKNLLATIASTENRPTGDGAMPEFHRWKSPVVTQRAAAVSAIACSPWAPLVAIAGQKQIVLYHTDTAELLGILEFPEGVAQGLRFSRNGDFLIAAGGQHSMLGIVAVYDVRSGQRVATVGDELDIVFDGDANDSMTRIAMGGPQKLLRIFDAADGNQLFELKKHTDWIYTVAYSPDGVLIASGDRSGGLCVWEAETGRLYLDLTDHKDSVHSVAWRDDSNVLVSASADGTVKLWDMNQGKAIKSIKLGSIVYDVAMDHQGRLATSGIDKQVKLWDATGKHLRDFPPRNESVLEVDFSHDGHQLVYGDWEGNVFLTHTDDSQPSRALAANPEPLADRIKTVQKDLSLRQKELVGVKANWSKAKSRSDAALENLTRVTNALTKIQSEVKKSQSLIDQASERVESISRDLPAWVATSRDLHDALIAVRVSEKENPSPELESESRLAAAELTLANHLKQISSLRKQKIESAKQSLELRSAVDGLNRRLKVLETERAAADQQSDAATRDLEAAKKELQQTTKRFRQTEQKVAAMVDQLDD